MNATAITFLEILKAALRGEPAAPAGEISPEEWQRLFRMARIHQILPLFYESVHALPSLPRELLAPVKQQVRHQVIRQTMQTQEFLELNRRLQEAGIRPLVVKGIICRNLYPKPDHRPSGDEDLLIPEEQFALCRGILTAQGLSAGEHRQDAYEIPYRRDGSPLYIELHRQLFPPESDAYGDLNRFFEGVFAQSITERIQDTPVDTLCPTDHLFYLICHAFKHFLHSGFGIRQVCDIILYANRYGTQVDWLQILNHCKAIRAEKFAAALFRIGRKHLTFDPELAAYPAVWREIPVDELPMLEDLLHSGLYGDATMSRRHSSSITLDAVAAQKQRKRSKNPVLLSAFPPAAKLEGRYPYLKKHPYLVPLAWGSRLWEYARETGHRRDSSAAEALQIGNDRIELMKLYGILEP